MGLKGQKNASGEKLFFQELSVQSLLLPPAREEER